MFHRREIRNERRKGGRPSPYAVEKGESCILDVRVMVTDARSYRGSTSAKMLEKAVREKKAKYKRNCLEQRRSFMALVY